MIKRYIKPPLIDAYITHHQTAAKTIKSSCLLVGGHVNACHESIALWDLSSLPADLDITSATANFFIFYNSPGCSKVVEAYPILSRWKPASTSLRHPPLTSPDPIATAAISTTTQQLSFGITPLIKKWQSCQTTNLGLLFRMRDPFSPDNFVSLLSGDYCDSNYWPFIEINYKPPCEVPCVYKPDLINVTELVHTTDNWSYTAPFDVLRYNYAYTISNVGNNPAIVFLSVSADGHHWLQQSAEHIILPSTSEALAPDTITHYARVAFCSQNPQQDTTLSICIQGRTTI